MEVGLGKRAGAFVLSVLIFFALTLIPSLLFGYLAGLIGVFIPSIEHLMFLVLVIVILIIEVGLIFVLGDIGKKIVGIEVVKENGELLKNSEVFTTTGFGIYTTLKIIFTLVSNILSIMLILVPSSMVSFIVITLSLVIALVHSIMILIMIILFFTRKDIWRSRKNVIYRLR